MGRGLGRLQQRILVMANYNRLADGLGVGHYTIELGDDAEPRPLQDYLDSLRYIHDRLTKPAYLFPEDEEIPDHPFYVHIVVERSKLLGFWLLPGNYDRFRLMCSDILRKLDETLARLQLDPVPGESKIRPAFEAGRATVQWSYKSFPTAGERWACRDRLLDAGLDLRHVFAYDHHGQKAHLLLVEALADLHSFREYLTDPRLRTQRRLRSGSLFDRQTIGAARYNRAIVATSKAILGLQKRGLVIRASFTDRNIWTNSGISLTEAGVREAERLSANTPDVLQGISLYAHAPC
jgi:hypothetical protein